MSHASKRNQALKIHGITKLKSDVILLSDIRLSNRNLVSAANDIKKTFSANLNHPYNFFYNSTKNKRGTGILISNNLTFSVLDRWEEEEENALFLKVLISGEQFTIGSIYGPNEQNINFYNKIKDKLTEWGCEKTILGGDWNCLFSSDSVQYNIDCINMNSCPNAGNSLVLNDICSELGLFDLYRYLYPDRRDYSYVPKDKNKNNRSRLDYFLVSSDLLNGIRECDIAANLQNSLFDHKAISLLLGAHVPVKSKSFQIRNVGLNIDTLDILVECAVAKTYLIHADPELNDNEFITRTLQAIGLLKLNCKEIKYPYEYWPCGSYDGNDVIRRLLQLEQLRIRCRDLDINRLSSLPVNVSKLTLMEVILNNIKNEVISFQSHFYKWKKNTINGMKTQLKNLKANYDTNFKKIVDCEWKLNRIIDDEAKRELENFAIFEVVNLEKMTPTFLQIAKQTKSSAKISDVKDDAGNEFGSDALRYSYIEKYYADIYKIKADTDLNLPGCVENFLGAEICNSNEVRNSKITQEQAAILDRDITAEELDSAVKGMKSKSAGGPDVIGVPVVKKYWHLLRLPLTEYCKEMMVSNDMSPSFKTSLIKQIPKKGDCSKIKNWRPISLLNVTYKVISKAINNRLKKISGTILSQAQKGFTNNRYLQECIINILENVAYCNESKTQGFLLAIDQAKAFDTVDQKFIAEVYKFFGLGERFIKMLTITTMGRNAVISFGDGIFSGKIVLGTGFTQGNGPSPLQFNFCQQILIFKIEFNPQIKEIDWPRFKLNNLALNVQVPAPGPDPVAAAPAPAAGDLGEQVPAADIVQQAVPGPNPDPPKGKVEGFADDATALGKAEESAIVSIKCDLVNFARVSGLKVNFEKCILMPLGFEGPPPDYMLQSGFTVRNKAKILGFDIYNDTCNFKKNFDNIIESIIKIRNFWIRFNLSLPGRPAVAKTLMLSKLGFIGSILTPDLEQLSTIEDIIYTFVKGKLNVARCRITLPVSKGGIGMISIEDYLFALKCSWIRRANNTQHDLWNKLLYDTGITDPDKFTAPPLCKKMFPVLSELAFAVRKFTIAALSINNNILESVVVANPIIDSKFKGAIYVNNLFKNWDIPVGTSLNIKVKDLLNQMDVKTKHDLEIRFGVRIDYRSYTGIFRVMRGLVKDGLLNNNSTLPVLPAKVVDILNKPKKGSKIYRKCLSMANAPPKDPNANIFKKFLVLCGFDQGPLPTCVKTQHNGYWYRYGVSNKLSEFLFKFINNLLGLNSRVHHFNRLVNEACTFCSISNRIPAPRETFSHIFFDCPETDQTLKRFEAKYLVNLNLDTEVKRRMFWFLGLKSGQVIENNRFLQISAGTIMFYVWDCKLRKSKQSFAGCLNFYFFHLDILRKLSAKFKDEMMGTDLDLCRYWDGERPRGW
jgi:exonuclease III